MKNSSLFVYLAALASLFVQSFGSIARAQAQVQCGFLQRSVASWNSDAFYAKYDAPSAARELAVIDQVRKGNVPSVSRQFKTITVAGKARGQNLFVDVPVSTDYLAIGTDQDFVRAPLTGPAAQLIASEMGYALPTAALVAEIYKQADVKLRPQPTNWYLYANAMRKGSNYVLFNRTIETQRQGRAGLVAGHKKDVVATNLLDAYPGRVAIYGWQQAGGAPIQPLAVPHDYSYEDYSHGIRFAGPNVRVRSSAGVVSVLPIAKAMVDPDIGPILNGGTKLNDPRAGRACFGGLNSVLGLNPCPPMPIVCPNGI